MLRFMQEEIRNSAVVESANYWQPLCTVCKQVSRKSRNLIVEVTDFIHLCNFIDSNFIYLRIQKLHSVLVLQGDSGGPLVWEAAKAYGWCLPVGQTQII